MKHDFRRQNHFSVFVPGKKYVSYLVGKSEKVARKKIQKQLDCWSHGLDSKSRYLYRVCPHHLLVFDVEVDDKTCAVGDPGLVLVGLVRASYTASEIRTACKLPREFNCNQAQCLFCNLFSLKAQCLMGPTFLTPLLHDGSPSNLL